MRGVAVRRPPPQTIQPSLPLHPPPSLCRHTHQDHPLVDDVRLTLDYDLDAPLASPRWLDGAQAFTGLPYHRGLVLLLDVRSLVPGSSSAAPAGWACLPVFEAAGPFVASGVYHLPLFQVRLRVCAAFWTTAAGGEVGCERAAAEPWGNLLAARVAQWWNDGCVFQTQCHMSPADVCRASPRTTCWQS